MWFFIDLLVIFVIWIVVLWFLIVLNLNNKKYMNTKIKFVRLHQTHHSQYSFVTFRRKILGAYILVKQNVHWNAKRQDSFELSSLLHICKEKKLCTFSCSKVCFEFVAYSLYPINANSLTMQGTSECVLVKI